MHVVFRESHGLEETETPMDLGQDPADLVVLSFSDSDLGAFAEGWRTGSDTLPSLRLANLAALKHPLSVDTYVEQTLSGARGILVRLIGGVPYWSYGLQQIKALADQKGLALAVLPADGRTDPQLDAFSTLPVSTLRRLAHLCDTGGAIAAQAALAQLSIAAGLYARPVSGSKTVPVVGCWTPETGICCPVILEDGPKPLVAVTFYRSFITAADLDPLEMLFKSLRARGHRVIGLFAPSLKAPDARGWLSRQIAHLGPDAIVNATSFSGQGKDGTSPLDAAGVPVFQIALSTARRAAWAGSERGLSSADLAMHVVLPELDGRLFAGVASFKAPQKRDPDLQYSRFAHVAEEERIDAVAARVDAWIKLARTDAKNRKTALVLSTYPGKAWNMAHAVGLDALASAQGMLADLNGTDAEAAPASAALAQELSCSTVAWPLDEYNAALKRLPLSLQEALTDLWGAPETDPSVKANAFHFHAVQKGGTVLALQPERGAWEQRDDDYHDLARAPRHGYVAFYLWLQSRVDCLVHIGAHGTLEWLPGKSVALSNACWPDVLAGSLPVVYPFIVNDPGEAAQAKRRLGAVTLGHVPPPMKQSETPERLVRLEALLDEFSNADGLDPNRRDRLQNDIRSEAQVVGLECELGLEVNQCSAEAITRIDRFVCDIKESQFGDGLHVYGRATSKTPEHLKDAIAAERRAFLEALAGKRIAAGPSGSPFRGRTDVLPTGRNITTIDPRAVPTRNAYAQGVKLGEELVRRHLQDHGDWPQGLIVDLWGSASMRTAGEEFAMALYLIGVRPVWDAGSERISGIEVVPITELDRPRIDVTLRVSGLFRDVFPMLPVLFGQAIAALAARDEARDWNPYAGQAEARVYGPAPGEFGLQLGADLETYTQEARQNAGAAWLAASSWSYDAPTPRPDAEGIKTRVAAADSFVHLQDLPETDLLLASDYAAHEAGFAAAKAVTGGSASLYHLDNTVPDAPRARALTEEIARVVHARAGNLAWAEGMMRHGFRGGAEIAATLEHMAAFAHLAQAVPAHLFDVYFEATLGNESVEAFLEKENPQALEAMRARFMALDAAGLWQSRRNSIRAALQTDA
ncbi:MAG: cobaltochelatase subunit CobN [Roseobacter sp.]